MTIINLLNDRITEGVSTGVTTDSDTYIVDPAAKLTVYAVLTSGSPSTGAKIQITGSRIEDIEDETAVWVDTERGDSTVSFSDSEPDPCNITGVRLSVTDGTWTLIVRQGFVR